MTLQDAIRNWYLKKIWNEIFFPLQSESYFALMLFLSKIHDWHIVEIAPAKLATLRNKVKYFRFCRMCREREKSITEMYFVSRIRRQQQRRQTATAVSTQFLIRMLSSRQRCRASWENFISIKIMKFISLTVFLFCFVFIKGTLFGQWLTDSCVRCTLQ